MFPHNRFNILMKLIVYLREETMSRVCAVCQVALVTSDSVTPWTVALQAPLPIGFSRQEYWDGLPCPSPGDLPKLGIEPRSPALQTDSLLLSHQGSPVMLPQAKKWPEARGRTWNRFFPHSGQKEPTLSTPWLETSCLWNFELIHFHNVSSLQCFVMTTLES